MMLGRAVLLPRLCKPHKGRQGSAWVAAGWLAVFVAAGCSSSDANSFATRNEPEKKLRAGDPGIVPKRAIPEEFRPIDGEGAFVSFSEATYDDGSPTHYSDGSPAYMADGSPIDYRPRNIQRQLAALPKSFARNIGQQVLATEGPANRPNIVYMHAVQESFVDLVGPMTGPKIDPQSGELAWPVIECTHPACAGRRSNGNLLFLATWPALTLNESGKRVWLWPENDAMMSLRCPSCNRPDHISHYSPPDVLKQADQLRKELARVRAKWTARKAVQ